MNIQVPGNLLLCGEYAVTLPGGKGIGAAISSYVHVKEEKATTFAILSRHQGKEFFWEGPFPLPQELFLVRCVMEEARRRLSEQGMMLHVPSCLLTIDSSSHYFSNGRKKGYGSSAAIASALAYYFLRLGLAREPLLQQEVFPTALAAHRKFQGGRGSGYDIAASLFGGLGLVIGGAQPSWQPLSLSFPLPFFLVFGEKSSKTANFIQRFEEVIAANPQKEKRFLEYSNCLVEDVVKCPDQARFQEVVGKMLVLNQELHEELGYCDELESLMRSFAAFAGAAAKPLGAGGELGAVFQSSEISPEVPIAQEGLVCHL